MCNKARKYILSFVIVMISLGAYSQRNIRYDVEPVVSQIQSDYVSNWKKVGEINGFRIQIASFSGVNSKSQAENVKYALNSLFPYEKTYVVYNEPYFRVQMGNYYSRLQAYKVLLKVKESYPGAYIVPEKIKYR